MRPRLARFTRRAGALGNSASARSDAALSGGATHPPHEPSHHSEGAQRTLTHCQALIYILHTQTQSRAVLPTEPNPGRRAHGAPDLRA